MYDSNILVLRNAKEIVTVCENREPFKFGTEQGNVRYIRSLQLESKGFFLLIR